MNDLIDEMLSNKVWAVLGVSSNREKYGYRIYKTLKRHCFTVFPINPKIDYIDGEVCYPNLNSLPEIPDVVNFVIPPKVSENEIEECYRLGINNIWMQPGSGSPAVVKLAKERNINIVYNKCVMIEIGKNKKN
jgi:predicted CoA-binding protein